MRDNIILLTLALTIWLVGAANIHGQQKFDAGHYTSKDRRATALAEAYGLTNADVAQPVNIWGEKP